MKRKIVSFCFCILLSYSQSNFAEKEVYKGVVFPQGNISFADVVVSYDPVVNSINQPMEGSRFGDSAIGIPNFTRHFGACYTQCQFSTLGAGGSITLFFDDNALTGSANTDFDLWIFEIGPDVEDSKIEIGIGTIDDPNDVNFPGDIEWYEVGKIFGSTSGVDIDPYINTYGLDPDTEFKFVRITDDILEGEVSGKFHGADIDAVGAISTVITESGGANCDIEIERTVEVIPGTGTNPSCNKGDPRPTSLSFVYTGGGCGASNNSQSALGKAYCEGATSEMDDNIIFEAESGKHDCAKKGQCYLYDVAPTTPPALPLGQEFVVTVSTGAHRTDFESQTKIILTNDDPAESEVNVLHTSCSAPLVVGEIFGSVTLSAINGVGGTAEDTTVYTYTVTNSGDPLTGIQVNDSDFGDIPPPITAMAENETVIVTHETAEPPILTVSSVSAIIQVPEGGTEICTDTDAPIDRDNDGINDALDNCANVQNADQADWNNDGIGDRCDITIDQDLDGVLDEFDNCPNGSNTDQIDRNDDGIGDACEDTGGGTCVAKPNADWDMLLMVLLACCFFYFRTAWFART